MKCQARSIYLHRETRYRRIEAASIAIAIDLYRRHARMSAIWLAAAGVRLSAAMTATILCPSGPHATPQ